MRSGRHLWMERDHRSPVQREMAGHRVFTGEPLGALTGSFAIGDDAGHEVGGETDDEGVAILQDLAAVGFETVLPQGLDGGAEGKFEAGRNHGGRGRGWFCQDVGSQSCTRASSSRTIQRTCHPAISVA